VDILVNHEPRRFVIEAGRLVGMEFQRYESVEKNGKLVQTPIDRVVLPADDVILAIGQEGAFPWIERDIGIAFDQWNMPVVDKVTHEATRAGVFFGGDAAWGPLNIIWAVEHAHQAAISIHNTCSGVPIGQRPPQGMTLASAKMGLHEWSYKNDYNPTKREKMSHVDLERRFKQLNLEVEMGFSAEQTAREVERCLNCDIQTVFTDSLCIECDACIDVCPVLCLTITGDGDEPLLRKRLSAPATNVTQDLFASGPLPQTKRLMVKDEDLCVHCGLCAERCPTAAWDMQKFVLQIPYAGSSPCNGG
jgi:ferredoxin